MLDFFEPNAEIKNNEIIIKPTFKNGKINDLMIRGGHFRAVWDETTGFWNTEPRDIVDIVDKELYRYAETKFPSQNCKIMVLKNDSTKSWKEYVEYIKRSPDHFTELDSKIIFSNTKVTKKDYASKCLPYALEEGECNAYEKLMSTLYDPDERDKLEWAIGSIVAGDSKNIQKFIVLYGDPGSGKGTVLDIIDMLFKSYCTSFSSKALGSSSNQFATEYFKDNPLVAIDNDGDLSRIEDNTRLNTIIAHEKMAMNAKYEKMYTGKVNAMLFIGCNTPVKITDGKSGILRRLIDVNPSGRTLPKKEYDILKSQIEFELGAIAYHCLQVYRDLGKDYYIGYRPLSMMYKTNAFYNFVENYYDMFVEKDGISLQDAWSLYKAYATDTAMEYQMPMYRFREELKNYFNLFELRARVDGKQVRKYYSGFKKNKFAYDEDYKDFEKIESDYSWLDFKEQPSLFDETFRDYPAQYDAGGERSKPATSWDKCTSILSDIETNRLHWVKTPLHLICIDFDLKDETGNKSFELNLEAASKFPPTYAELSRSGGGIHLYYIYEGDVTQLSAMYSKDIEVKVYTGKSSLRRMVTKCNDIPIATLKSGLPLKGEKKVIDFEAIRSEKSLRALIDRNLNKEIHDSTASSVDFIKKILNETYEKNQLSYDVRDMKQKVYIFASKSTHQKDKCLKDVSEMHFVSRDIEGKENTRADIYFDNSFTPDNVSEMPFTFYDIEIFPNLCVVVYKTEDKEPIALVNPKPDDIVELLKMKLVGFNCRKYDNHILYGILLGYDNYNLYLLSQNIISGNKSAMFGNAYGASWTDVFDFCSTKQSLKKWEIDLDIHHQECPYRWDEPVPEDKWDEIVNYCVNDVLATEAVFKANQGDYIARETLADIAGMTVNDTTNTLTTKIIFGNEKKPKLVYTDLATGEQWDGDDKSLGFSNNKFPGYEYKLGDDGKYHNIYRGTDLGFGGYVYAEPGIYHDVALLDVSNMHGQSLKELNALGEFTQTFADLREIRTYIKHGEYDKAKTLFDGKLSKYFVDTNNAKQLSQALKIAINSVYGLTSAKFENPFKDPRNVNNIVALRGALFMKTLQDEVTARGYTVAHIKTDSIKIPNADESIIKFCMDFAKKYGYEFEHEATYDRMCLVNDAVYIAKYSDDEKINGDHAGEWTATGAQFQHPYVFKYLFSKEPITYKDMCETKSVQTALYLDMNEKLQPMADSDQKELDAIEKYFNSINPERTKELYSKLIKKYRFVTEEEISERYEFLLKEYSKSHNYIFIGKTGLFNPIKPGCGGGLLMREKDGRYSYATGAKGYRWLESEYVVEAHKENDIDETYFRKLVDDAKDEINLYGDYYAFASDSLPVDDVEFDITSDELPF